MMRLAVLAALLMVWGPAWADDFVRIGQIGGVTATFVGCKDQADEDKFKGLVREGDREAAVAFADGRGSSCIRLLPGTLGTVEDLSLLHGTSCLRPKGDPDCYWTPTEFVGKP